MKALASVLLSLCFCVPVGAERNAACLDSELEHELLQLQDAVKDLQIHIPDILESVQEMNVRIPEIQVHVPEISVQIPQIQIPEIHIQTPVNVHIPEIHIPEIRLQIPKIDIEIPEYGSEPVPIVGTPTCTVA